MPLYEYECDDCSHRFERQQRFSDPPVTNCPECDGSVHKVFHPASVIFKGSGWYVTDNRPSDSNVRSEQNGSTKPKEAPAKNSKDSAESKAAGTAKTDSGGESKASSTKKE